MRNEAQAGLHIENRSRGSGGVPFGPLSAARRHKGNGGRHCCQPPLRRATDLPVFVTWLINLAVYQTRSRSWLTSSGVASHPTAPSVRRSRFDLLDCAARRFAGLSFAPARHSRASPSMPKPSDVLRPFLGRPLLRPALLTEPSKSPEGDPEIREPRRA